MVSAQKMGVECFSVTLVTIQTGVCSGENLKSNIHCCYQLADVKRSSSLPPIFKEFL